MCIGGLFVSWRRKIFVGAALLLGTGPITTWGDQGSNLLGLGSRRWSRCLFRLSAMLLDKTLGKLVFVAVAGGNLATMTILFFLLKLQGEGEIMVLLLSLTLGGRSCCTCRYVAWCAG